MADSEQVYCHQDARLSTRLDVLVPTDTPDVEIVRNVGVYGGRDASEGYTMPPVDR